MKSMSQPKLAKNSMNTALKRRALDDIQGLILLRTSFHSQFPLKVVDLRPQPSSKGFFPYMTISHISCFEKQYL